MLPPRESLLPSSTSLENSIKSWRQYSSTASCHRSGGSVGLGYDGSDYFSPDFPYVTTDPNQIARHLGTINELLNAKGLASIQIRDISSGPNQLRALVDLCHLSMASVLFSMSSTIPPAVSFVTI